MKSFIILILSSILIYGILFEEGNSKIFTLIERVKNEKTKIYCELYNNSSIETQKRLEAIYQPSNIESARCQLLKVEEKIIKAFEE